MRYNIYIRRLLIRVTGMLIIGMLSSCAGADLGFDDDPGGSDPPLPPDDPTKGAVTIRPDRSTHQLPEQLYYFYPLDGQKLQNMEQEVISLASDNQGNLTGSLPPGHYHVIAVNRQVTGAAYQGMDRFETARVATVQSTRSAPAAPDTRATPAAAATALTRATISQPGAVYTTVLQDIPVTTGSSTVYEPAPVLLTRSLTFRFGVDTSLLTRLTGVTGSLQGIYPSVQLFTGETAAQEIAQSPQMQIAFTATSSGSQWEATIRTFGLCDPQHGEAYQNTLSVNLAMGSEVQTTTLNLTETLSSIMDKYQGSLPLDIPLEMNIDLQWKGVEVEAKVRSWKDGGNTEVVMDN